MLWLVRNWNLGHMNYHNSYIPLLLLSSGQTLTFPVHQLFVSAPLWRMPATCHQRQHGSSCEFCLVCSRQKSARLVYTMSGGVWANWFSLKGLGSVHALLWCLCSGAAASGMVSHWSTMCQHSWVPQSVLLLCAFIISEAGFIIINYWFSGCSSAGIV